uniref:Uncharacterized protein n=1 Tax=Plectus sambesii TaxID=2011161 RepID=A0A914W4L4_9BILA
MGVPLNARRMRRKIKSTVEQIDSRAYVPRTRLYKHTPGLRTKTRTPDAAVMRIGHGQKERRNATGRSRRSGWQEDAATEQSEGRAVVPEIDGCQQAHTSCHQRNGTERWGGVREGGTGDPWATGRASLVITAFASSYARRRRDVNTARGDRAKWHRRGRPAGRSTATGRLRQRRKRLLVRRSPSPPPTALYDERSARHQ